MVQGGDFTKGDGTGGESIYGGPFKDENLTFKHDQSCLLSMANRGPGTNGSQFFITSKPVPHLDGKHVVFGRLVLGTKLFRKIENIPTDKKDRPHATVLISNCGELERVAPAKPTTDSRIPESDLTKSNKDSKSKQKTLSDVDSSGSESGSLSDSDSNSESSSIRHKSRKRSSLKQSKSRRHSKKSKKSSKKRSHRSKDSNDDSDNSSNSPDTERNKASKLDHKAKEPSEEPIEDVHAVPLPEGWLEPKSFLHREKDSRSNHLPIRNSSTHKDAKGRQVKGRGNLKYDRSYSGNHQRR
ncbi:hypothetical protein BDEG_20567 [Batrachochytrium dendrobatidis JEL423]|uniref:Peptidyl-prolyl cis-trans isomerase n=1 Tax=Batrachochytrium dendrobatidis (strain JEL423) TaxID=403673 RepID=A0A177W8F6_BATDL|nr:hypothetical protein BDEG_20567 [Batrachochytrium dendrobatidis JEL423]